MAIKSRNKVSAAFSMSSMTDIVFLLLIFFIIVSTMISPNALNVKLPKSGAKTTGKQTVSISIDKDLNYFIGEEPVAKTAIESKLKKMLAGQEEPGIILHCERNIPLQNAVTIMDIANRNKYKLVLATTPNE
jgi:biopolymer transport protein ExbD